MRKIDSWQLNVYASFNRINWGIDRRDGQHVWMNTSWEGVGTTYYKYYTPLDHLRSIYWSFISSIG